MAGLCVYELAMLVWTLNRCGMWLSEADAEIAFGHGDRFLKLYRHLALAALAGGKCRWRLRPKMHYVHHTILELRVPPRQNPFFATCFLDEDFVGKISKLASQTHRAGVEMRTIQRYLVLLGQRWLSLRRRLTFRDLAEARKRARAKFLASCSPSQLSRLVGRPANRQLCRGVGKWGKCRSANDRSTNRRQFCFAQRRGNPSVGCLIFWKFGGLSCDRPGNCRRSAGLLVGRSAIGRAEKPVGGPAAAANALPTTLGRQPCPRASPAHVFLNCILRMCVLCVICF